ncbi:copper resistance CopC/CopD family protein [Paenibacillus radicis (ex Gao et al. 2016)]|uniref:copper resistance CopC/CopD family protein n=1 Tax=Paenibacillus radicis (ex Gao et al. 2016) TaxID=1737354 RepID=UPI00166AF0A4|nr:copper resistance protein CopC [Paenibacillus radicis (ex Gao et al. 2016)]
MQQQIQLRKQKRRLPQIVLLVFAVIWMVGLLPSLMPVASAHASLEKRVPEANAKLKESPPFVELSFSEAIEPSAGSLQVLDSQKRKVTSDKPTLNEDRTTLKLALPSLQEGVYTASFHIVSEDGHPVSGSYVFVVGNPPEWKDGSTFNDDAGGSSGSHGLSSDNWLLFTVRIVYYLSLLIAAGLMIWSALYRNPSESVSGVHRRLLLLSLRVLLISLLLHIFIQAKEIMAGQPFSAWGELFTGTATGRAWLELIVVVLAGFVIQRAPMYVKLLWAVIILAIESLIGHPAANDLKILTLAADWIHLVAAAIWAGGLLALVVLWFEDRKEAGRFGASFSKGALISLVALVVSGILMMTLFLPKFSYLWLTPWGIMLAIKSGLTLLVIGTGAWLRIRMSKSGIPDGRLLRVDLGLMLVIVAIAAIFTYISPLPANEPIRHHEMGEDMHYTLSITPNVPGGENEAKLQIWLPEAAGEPKAVVLRLHPQGSEEAPLDVPLAPFDDESYDSYPGYARTSYQATGAFLPYASKWKAEIRVMTQDDIEMVKRLDFVNY